MKNKLVLVMALSLAMAVTACTSAGSSVTTSSSKEASAASSNAESASATSASTEKTKEASASASASTTVNQQAGELILTTGGEKGTYYGFGKVLADTISRTTDTKVEVVTSGGSQANIEAVAKGEAQIGFCQTDVLSYAYNGTRLFEGKDEMADARVLCNLYAEPVQIVTLNPEIKSVADLKGKKVSLGEKSSGVYFNAVDILGIYELSEEDITPTYQSFGDSVEALRSGALDAVFLTAGVPTEAVSQLAATDKVRFVGLDQEHLDLLIAESPYYSKFTITADEYGTEEDVTTVAVGAVIIAGADLADADAFNILAGIYDNADEIAKEDATGTALNLNVAASVQGVPYHKGAAAYFATQNITIVTD